MRFLLLLLLAACGAPAPVTSVTPEPEPRTLGPLPHERHGHRAHVLDDELIVFGGFSHSAPERGTHQTWIQDLTSGEWRRGADLNEGKSFFASVVADGAIYAIGGSIERYDLAQDEWELVLPAGEMQSSHFGAGLVGRRIVAVGGYPLEKSGVHVFDLDTREVRTIDPIPGFTPGDHFHFVTTLGGELHVIGGLLNEEFVPSRQHWILDGDEWRAGPEAPAGLWAKFAIAGTVDDSFYAFTGLGEDREDALGLPKGLRYDDRNRTWTGITSAPVLLVMPTTVADGGKLHLLGGGTVDDTPVPRHAIVYDPALDRWSD